MHDMKGLLFHIATTFVDIIVIVLYTPYQLHFESEIFTKVTVTWVVLLHIQSIRHTHYSQPWYAVYLKGQFPPK